MWWCVSTDRSPMQLSYALPWLSKARTVKHCTDSIVNAQFAAVNSVLIYRDCMNMREIWKHECQTIIDISW